MNFYLYFYNSLTLEQRFEAFLKEFNETSRRTYFVKSETSNVLMVLRSVIFVTVHIPIGILTTHFLLKCIRTKIRWVLRATYAKMVKKSKERKSNVEAVFMMSIVSLWSPVGSTKWEYESRWARPRLVVFRKIIVGVWDKPRWSHDAASVCRSILPRRERCSLNGSCQLRMSQLPRKLGMQQQLSPRVPEAAP